jgi:hypothetical protein
MKLENAVDQLQAVARLAGLPSLFGKLSFGTEDVEALGDLRDGERMDVRFSSKSGLIGVMHIEAIEDPDPKRPGLVVGLRGWVLSDDVASVE